MTWTRRRSPKPRTAGRSRRGKPDSPRSKVTTTFRCRATTLGFFFAVAFLALQITPAAAADPAGSSTATIERGRTIAFSDVYAFRAEDRYDKKKQVTVVILGESPLDKKAMTAALKKERDASAAMTIAYLAKMTSAVFWIEQSGKIGNFGVFVGGANQCMGRDVKSDVRVNTAKRAEGRVSDDDKRDTHTCKIDLRFAADLADVGAPVGND
jgi:hypothetical protein